MSEVHFRSVAAMIEDLRSEDPEARLNSMRGLHCIAQTLGHERTRNELLPYITDYTDDDDEVLRTMAKVLGTMMAEVGGVQHVSHLFTPLELLCSLDEVTVRDEAIASLVLLAKTVFASEKFAPQQEEFVALVMKLAKSDQPFRRSSACGLIGPAYPTASIQLKKEIRAAFAQLCADEEILVRRAACIALGASIAPAFERQCNELVPLFCTLAKDTNDSVRLQAVATAVGLIPHLSDLSISQVVAIVKALATDSSWRVRYMLAERLSKLAGVFSPRDVIRVCLPTFRGLCQDSEAEIRAAAVFSVDSVLSRASEDPNAKKDSIAMACKLATDTSPHVRICVGSALLKAVPFATADICTALILPACNDLLSDTDPEVRLAVLSGFSSLSDSSAPATFVQALAPKLIPIVSSTLSKDPKWRVREVVVSQAPALIKVLGSSADELVGVCFNCLTDRVATIRAAACQACVQLAQAHGTAWMRSSLFPKIFPMARHESFGQRVTFLQLIQSLVTVVDSAVFLSDIMPILSGLSSDAVPNVRLHVVKSIYAANASGLLPSGEVEVFLVRFSSDKDVDVRELAKRGPPRK